MTKECPSDKLDQSELTPLPVLAGQDSRGLIICNLCLKAGLSYNGEIPPHTCVDGAFDGGRGVRGW